MEHFVYPTIDMSATGRNIRSKMVQAGLSVLDIKEALSFASTQSVYHWLSGRTLPSLDSTYALSELLRVPMDDLIIGSREFKLLWQSYPPDGNSHEVDKKLSLVEHD